jgi:preprotein translocase subunit SecD
MSNLKSRFAIIGALILASLWALFPHKVERSMNRGGVLVVDTVRQPPLKLGLDLQGGMHLALEIDESKGAVADKSEALDRALTVVRSRIDQFGVSEPVVQKVGEERIIVELPGIDDPARAQAVVQQSAFLQFQITDKTQALERSLPRIDAILKAKGLGTVASGAPGAPAAGQKGITGLFTPGDSAPRPTVGDSAAPADSATRVASADSAPADTAVLGATTGGPLSSVVQPTGQMPGEYVIPASSYLTVQRYLQLPEVQAALPPGKVIRWGSDSVVMGTQTYRTLYVLDARPIITGEYLTDAKPANDPVEGNLVTFTLNAEGGRRFKNETARHLKDNMAVVLDDRVMTAPVIQGSIGRNGQITMGNGSLQDAQDLALVLRAGALPVPLKIVETREIGASLGQDSIREGMRAGILGIALVILIMVVYYRFSGFLAVLGLVFYTLTTLAVLAGFDAVLTLPGIAGFVLSIGMAVDANFLIFERIREELDAGRTVRAAVDEGFTNALSAIIDTHMTTALTAVILYQFGTGPVRGFAVALLAGLAASMMSAVYVVRTLFLLWLSRNRSAQTLSI